MIKKGIVYCSTGSHYRVESEGHFYVCRIKGKFRVKGIKSTNPIAVGDKVLFIIDPNSEEKTGSDYRHRSTSELHCEKIG